MKAGETYDAVVIGSGFGGAICALRLAEAGKSVLILERGRRWKPGEFPRDLRKVDRVLWRHSKKSTAQGLYDVRFFSGIGAVVASGVGGGSLIYANIHIRPDASVFDDPRWPRSINRQTLDPYYDRVAQMFGVQPLPEDIPLAKRDAFRSAAQKMGRPIFDPDQAVSWKQPGGLERHACQLCAECEFGCQYGAKNTLDFTYLAQAEKLGAIIRPGSVVTHITPIEGGGYEVAYSDTNTGKQLLARGRQVVLSAGTLGTVEILFRSRDVIRTLPHVSRTLGRGYSGNGDFLGNLQQSRMDLEPWKGPDVTSVMRFTDVQPAFTLAAPTFNHASMAALAAMGQPHLAWLRPLVSCFWPALNWLVPLALKFGLLSHPPSDSAAASAARMSNLFAIGRDNAGGQMRFKSGRLDIEWNYAGENALLIRNMESAMGQVSEAYGASYSPIATWELFRRTLTVHSLGGCHLSESTESGVVSTDGQVHGYPGLYVADGSIIPTSIGFHPVMTISALAERIAEGIAAS